MNCVICIATSAYPSRWRRRWLHRGRLEPRCRRFAEVLSRPSTPTLPPPTRPDQAATWPADFDLAAARKDFRTCRGSRAFVDSDSQTPSP